ncbi:hypothetical protein ACLB1Q_09170 [Escherichia coli]
MHRNLELCFPEMSEQERRANGGENFESVGMGLMETGMAWLAGPPNRPLDGSDRHGTHS